MLRSIAPLILLVLAGLVIFLYIKPQYDVIKLREADKASFDTAIDKYDEAKKKLDDLVAQSNQIPKVEQDRLEKMIPDNVDNIRLLLDMQGIAARYNMAISNIRVGSEGQSAPGTSVGPSTTALGTVALSFSTVTNYDNLQKFLKDLERSLRIVEVKTLDVVAGSQPNSYQVSMTLNLLWLKGQNLVTTQ